MLRSTSAISPWWSFNSISAGTAASEIGHRGHHPVNEAQGILEAERRIAGLELGRRGRTPPPQIVAGRQCRYTVDLATPGRATTPSIVRAFGPPSSSNSFAASITAACISATGCSSRVRRVLVTSVSKSALVSCGPQQYDTVSY
jgi:hypothetical protein